MPGRRACRSHANAVRLSADRSEISQRGADLVPGAFLPLVGQVAVHRRAAAQALAGAAAEQFADHAELAGLAQDPIASQRPSRPISSSSVAPAHRHCGPDSSATAAASPGPGRQVSPAPSLANSASRGSRCPSAISGPLPRAAAPSAGADSRAYCSRRRAIAGSGRGAETGEERDEAALRPARDVPEGGAAGALALPPGPGSRGGPFFGWPLPIRSRRGAAGRPGVAGWLLAWPAPEVGGCVMNAPYSSATK